MIRFAALLAPILLAATNVSPPVVTPSDQTSIRTFLTRMLTAYVANHDAPPWQRAFTPKMRKLLALNQRLNRGVESEALGADPICGCQDWKTITVTEIKLAKRPDGDVIATVRILNFAAETRVFVLARTPAGWRVDDVLEQGNHGLHRALLQDNARLSHGRG